MKPITLGKYITHPALEEQIEKLLRNDPVSPSVVKSLNDSVIEDAKQVKG